MAILSIASVIYPDLFTIIYDNSYGQILIHDHGIHHSMTIAIMTRFMTMVILLSNPPGCRRKFRARFREARWGMRAIRPGPRRAEPAELAAEPGACIPVATGCPRAAWKLVGGLVMSSSCGDFMGFQ